MSHENDKEDFASLFEKSASPKRTKDVRVGDRVEGIVVRVGSDAVFVELDGKRQAFLEADELRGPDGEIRAKEGEKIAAHVIEADEAKGIIRLGRTLGRASGAAQLEQAKSAGVAVDGKVTGVNKGGLDVDFGGTRAFCPFAQIDVRRIEEAEAKELVGQTLRFLVTDVRDGGKNVVVSRRAFLQQSAQENATRALSDIVPGAVLTGTVTGVRDFGAFVDLGGIEGLIPRSEISHDRNVSAADALKPGDTVEVQVREIKDAEPSKRGGPTKKITLSLKALAADPWAELSLSPGLVVLGTVTRTTEFGAFVRLAPAVEGLLHVSELGKSNKVGEGESIAVVVKSIDRTTKKIALTLAPDGAAPGAVVATDVAVKVNAIVSGTVERIEAYGLFVQIDGTKGRAGRGLVPTSEIGVPHGTDLRKKFPEGTKVTAKVLETADGRIRLSIKGAHADEERADYEAARAKTSTPASLGTFADLLRGKKL